MVRINLKYMSMNKVMIIMMIDVFVQYITQILNNMKYTDHPLSIAVHYGRIKKVKRILQNLNKVYIPTRCYGVSDEVIAFVCDHYEVIDIFEK